MRSKVKLGLKFDDEWFTINEIVTMEYASTIIKNQAFEMPVDIRRKTGRIIEILSNKIILDCSKEYESKIKTIYINEIFRMSKSK